MQGFLRTGPTASPAIDPSQVKNVFRQLIDRVKGRLVREQDASNYPSLTLRKGPCMDGPRKWTGSMALGHSLSPKKTGIPPNSRYLRASSFHSKNSPKNPPGHLSIKGSLSNRCNSDLPPSKRQIHAKIQEYNQLLITKSYFFAQLQQRKVPSPSKQNNNRICNFLKIGNNNLRQFKRQQCLRRRKILPLENAQVRNKTECADPIKYVDCHPWETEKTFDLF